MTSIILCNGGHRGVKYCMGVLFLLGSKSNFFRFSMSNGLRKSQILTCPRIEASVVPASYFQMRQCKLSGDVVLL